MKEHREFGGKHTKKSLRMQERILQQRDLETIKHTLNFLYDKDPAYRARRIKAGFGSLSDTEFEELALEIFRKRKIIDG